MQLIAPQVKSFWLFVQQNMAYPDSSPSKPQMSMQSATSSLTDLTNQHMQALYEDYDNKKGTVRSQNNVNTAFYQW